MPRIRFLPIDVTTEVAAGTSLFDAGAAVKAGIETACVGKGTCGLCRVKVIAGNEHLEPLTDEDTKHLGNVFHITKVRLACRTRIAGDAEVEVMTRRKVTREPRPPGAPPRGSRDR